MPVWHEITSEARKSGELQVVGIVQEQHPDRARLFAQWQEFDWPILWDPLNLTESEVVPNFYLIDEHGVVRSTRPRRDALRSDFLDVEFETMDGVHHAPSVTRSLLDEKATSNAHWYARLLWQRDAAASEVMSGLAPGLDHASPETLFRAGVAARLRYDSEGSEATDFEDAVSLWSRALDARPSQYIWRRRLQQYGPRLDKPYPFYSWVDQAKEEIAARGETPIALRTHLTASERLDPRATERSSSDEEPDAQRKVPTADGDWLELTAAICWPTSDQETAPARVHIDLRPRSSVHWNNETDEMRVWIDAGEDWTVNGRLYRHPNAEAATSNEVRQIDFEITPPGPASTLNGYVLFHACEDEQGKCVYLRQDFKIEFRR